MKSPKGSRPAVLARKSEKLAARECRALAKVQIMVNPFNLMSTSSYGMPDFVERGHYIDRAFNCRSCGIAQNWTATQQKWWYESAKGDVWTVAVLCRACRRRERERREGARKVHVEGLAKNGKKAG